jgi:hypothetical protein
MDRNPRGGHITGMSLRQPRFSAFGCIPALVAALGVALPARAAEPDQATKAQADLQAAKRVRNYGIGTFSVGAIGLAVGAGLEHKRRTDVCAEILSADHDDACDRSKMANISLLAIGTTLTIGGAVVMGLGISRMKRARRVLDERGIAFAPAVGRGFAGAVFTARF